MDKRDLKKLEKLDQQLDKEIKKMPEYPFLSSLTTEIDFALTNVRVNGRERKVSYPDIKLEFDKLIPDYERCLKAMPRILKKIKAIGNILNLNYMICPDCKGKQVIRTKHNAPGHAMYSYDDCFKCDGHGVIRKP